MSINWSLVYLYLTKCSFCLQLFVKYC